jgi:hypothetical protein
VQPTGREQRWYEKRPKVKWAVHVMENTPFEAQTVVASFGSALLVRDREKYDFLHVTKSLGHDKVLSLHKSKRKARIYDRNPAFHQLMNDWMLLKEEGQDYLASEISYVLNWVLRYFKVCKMAEINYKSHYIQEIASRYFNEGAFSAEAFLLQVEENYTNIAKLHVDVCLVERNKEIVIHRECLFKR